MDILIHENGKDYDSKAEDFDYSRWYVFLKDAYAQFSLEQIKCIEDNGGYVELALNGDSHYSKPKYRLRNLPDQLLGPLQAILDD